MRRRKALGISAAIAAVACSSLVGVLVSEAADSAKRDATNNAVAAGLLVGSGGGCAATLNDGTILITGGRGANGPLANTQFFDAKHGATDAAPMSSARADHACATLPDGRVLVAGGGTHGGGTLNTAEVFDPKTGAWKPAGLMFTSRSGVTGARLPGGRILIAGGQSNGNPSHTLEIFDPSTNSFSTVSSFLSSPRMQHASVSLKDGRVLIAGGTDGNISLDTIDVFDPATGTVSPFSKKLSAPRAGLSATVLLDGRVYFAGGNDGKQDLATAEIFNPKTGALTPAAPMLSARQGHVAIRVPNNNSILIVGGNARGGAVNSVEFYIPWWNVYKPLRITGSGGQKTFGFSSSSEPSKSPSGMMALTDATSSDTPVLPTLTTDQPDYSPGQTATISGAGWPASSDVSFVLARDPQTLPDTTWTATTDADGNFTTTYDVVQDDLNVTFTLTASVGTDATAQIQQTVTFTDAGSYTYSPTATTLNIAAGGNNNFSQDVTAPKNNGTFTAHLAFAGSGGSPIPGAWVSLSPSSASPQTFATGGSSGSAVTKTWTVTVTVPINATPGTYTGTLTPAVDSGSGPSLGTVPTLTVTVPAAPVFTSADNTTFAVGVAGSFTVTATGFPAPTFSESGTLPSGVTFNTSTHVLSGTPTAGTAGTYPITFAATNSQGTANQNFTVTVENPPTVTISPAGGQANPTNTSPINFTAVFSASVTGFTSSGVTITGTAGGTKTVTVTGSGATYNVAVSGMTGGTVIATVNAGAAQDAALFGNTASSASTAVTYDNTAPTTASVTTPANGSAFRGATAPTSFTGNVADNLSGTGLNANSATFTVQRGSDSFYWNGSTWQAGVFGLATSHLATTSNTAATWTSSATLPTWASEAEGAYTVQATATDKAGNTFTGTAASFIVDNTPPPTSTVTTPADGSTFRAATVPAAFSGSAGDNTGGSGLNTNSVRFNLRRSSDGFYWNGSSWVSGVFDLGASNAAATGNTLVTWTSSATMPTWSSQSEGSYTVNALVTDKAGNSLRGLAITFTLDNTRPTAAITYSPTGPVKSGATLTITATFNEPMADSPVVQFSISGANTMAATNMTKVDGTHYTGTHVVGAGNGTATVALSVGTDTAGNLITSAPTSGATFTVDNTRPTAAISYSPTGAVNAGTSLTITATFNEAMADSPVVQIAISGQNTLVATNMTKVDSTHYTYVHTVGAGNGNATVALSTGTDVAGNLITAAPTSGATFAVDNLAPSVAISAPSSTSTNVGPVTYTVTYSDGSITLAPGNITLNQTGAANATVAVATVNATTRTVTLSSITGEGTLGISIAAGTASDTAGNLALGAGPSATFTVDNTSPVTASVTTPVDGSIYLGGGAVPTTFGGSTADNAGGVGLNANSTTITLQRGSDDLYWDGANFTSATPVPLATTHIATTGGTAVTWSKNSGLPAWATQPGDTYTIQATATDKAGNAFTGDAISFTLAGAISQRSIGTQASNAPMNSLTQTGLNVSTGNTIFVTIAMDAIASTVTVSDTGNGGSNVYTKDSDVTGSGVRTLIFSAPVTHALTSGAITISVSTNVNIAATFFSFNGLASPAIDTFHTGFGNGISLSSGATTPTSQPNELLIGAMGIDAKQGGNGFGSFTAGAGFTTLTSIGTGGQSPNPLTMQPVYQIVSATGTYSATGTITNSTAWAAGIATYKITFPTVVSINRTDPDNALNGSTVHFTVTFSEQALNVDGADFALATTGSISGASITNVTDSGDGITYTVTVNSGSGVGTIGLNLVDNDSINDLNSIPLGGTGAGNGNTTGQVYTIGNPATTTTVTSSVNPSVFGQAVTFTATVTSASGTPTGSVQFQSDGVNFGSAVPLVSGVAVSGANSSLTAGSHTVTATYSPTGIFTGSIGTLSGAQTVNKAAQTITFNQPSSPAAFGSTFAVAPTSSSSLAVAVVASGGCSISSGTVTMTSGTTDCTLTASQAGSDNYLGATDVVRTVNASKATQTITFDQPSTPAVFGSTFGVAPTASSGLTVTVVASGGCSILSGTVTMTSGTTACTLTASQAGSDNYLVATDMVRTVNASKATQTITFTQPTSPAFFGSTFAVAPTSSSSLAVAVVASGGCSISNGTVTMTSGTTDCTLTASQAGSDNYLGATDVVRTVNASKATQTITFDQPSTPAVFGSTFGVAPTASSSLTVTVVASGGCSILSGTVTMTSGTTPCTLTASQSGGDNYQAATNVARIVAAGKAAASVTLSNLLQTYSGLLLTPTAVTNPLGLTVDWTNAPQISAGSYSVTATINNLNYAGSASGAFTIGPATAVVTIVDPNVMWTGNPQGATISTNPPDLAYTATYSGTGQTSYVASTTQPTNPGTYSVSVTVTAPNYLGSAGVGTLTINNTDASTPSPVSPLYNRATNSATTDVTVNFATVSARGITSISTVTPSFPVDMTKYKLSASPVYSDLATNATFTGSIEVCFVYVPANFIKPANLVLLHFNSVTNQWETTGSAVDQAHTKVCGTVTSLSPFTLAESITTTTTLSADNTSPTFGAQINLTAAVSPTDATGTVQFYDNGNALGSPVSVSGGQAQLATSALTAGAHSITATYSGDGYYTGGTSAVVVVTVAKANQAPLTLITTSPLTFNQSETLSVTGGTTGGAVTYNKVSGSCTIVGNQLTANSGTGSCTLTATMAGNSNYNDVTSTPANTVTLAKANQAALTLITTSTLTFNQSETLSVTGGSTGGAVTYSMVSGSCTIVGSQLTANSGTGVCTLTATMAGNSDYNDVTSTPANSVTLQKANQTITFDQPSTPAVFGSTFGVAPTASSGLAVTVVASGGCSILSGTVTMTSGTTACTLTASQSGSVNYKQATDVARIVAASKAAASVTLSNLQQTYTSLPLTPTAVTNPVGLTVDWTNAPQINAGSYSVTATINNANYAGSASGAFVIGPATAIVSVTDPKVIWTGSAQGATISTTPLGLAFTATYTGTGQTTYAASTTQPTNPGTYSVSVTVTNPNYFGSAGTGTLTINNTDAATPSLVNPLYNFSTNSAATDVTVNFAAVSARGITSISTVTPSFPVDMTKYKLSASPVYSDLATNATFTGSIEVCFVYVPANFIKPANLVLLHFNSVTNQWETTGSTVDQAHTKVCGTVTSLSPFTLAESITTTTTLSADNTSPTYGAQIHLTAAVSPTDATGTVQFYDNGNALGSPVSVSGGQAQLATSALTGGAHSITATYSPDTYYVGSTSAVVSVNVAKANQAVVIVTAPTDATYGQAGGTVTASGGSGTGAYSFSAGGSTACAVNAATGSITVTNGAGTCAISATRAGDNNYLDSAASTPAAVVIHKAAQAVVNVSAPSDATYGQPGGTVTASGGSGTGAYSFSAAGSTACAVNATTGAITVTNGAGTCAISATRAGDNNYLDSAASTPATVVIQKGTQATVSVSAPSEATYGQAGGTATASGGSGAGVYSFSAVGSTACSVDATTGVITVTSGTGTCSITATRAGDGNYNASAASTPATVVIQKGTQATVSVSAPGEATYGQAGGTATASGGSGAGVYSFSAVGSTACSVDATTGVITVTSGTGTCSITTTRAGDGNYNASAASTPATVAIQKAAQATVNLSAPSEATYGQPGGTATASGGSGAGAYSFSAVGSTACSVDAATGTITVTSGTGICSITATRASDNNYHSATSTPATVVIHKAAQAAVNVSAPSDATYGQPGGTVTASGGSGTGGYSFSAAGSTACAVNAATGAITVSNGTGTCAISATRAGDNNYLDSAASTPATVVIQKGTQATVSASAPSDATYGQAGGTATASGGSGTAAYSFSAAGSTACSVDATTGAITVTSGGGTCSITAIRAGDNNYNASAASAPAPVTIHKGTQATVNISAPTDTTYGQPGGTATTSGGSGTGAYSFSAGVSTACSVDATTGAITVTGGTGTCLITATRASDSNYIAATSAPATVTIHRAAQATVNMSAPSDATYGQPGGTATASGGSGAGAYSFSAGVSSACSVVATTGAITVTSGSGTCSITATRAGDNNYDAAASTPATVVIHKAAQATVNVSAPSDATYGQPGGTATTSGGSGTGAYSFSAAGSTACAANPSTGAITVTSGTGTCSITATRLGDSNYFDSAVSTPATVTILKASQTITFPQPASPVSYGGSLTLGATATSGLPVSYSVSGVCTLAGANVSITSGTGNCINTASQPGNNNYLAASPVTRTVAAAPAAVSVILGSPSPASVQYSDPVSIKASVIPLITGLSVPTGSVQLLVDGTAQGSPVTLAADGTATIMYLVGFAPGTSHTLSIGYSGSTFYAVAAAASPASFTVAQEDARGYYTGDFYAVTSSATATTTTVNLGATIKDITAVTGDPASEPYGGDIRKSNVTFVVKDQNNNQVGSFPASVVLNSASDTTIGTATYSWNVTIPCSQSPCAAIYTVSVVVSGGYYVSAGDDAVVEVSQPGTNFITGGGYIVNSTSTAGKYAGSNGSKTNLGFSVKYNKSGTNLQGNMNIIIRSAGRVYQIKGNSLTSLVVNTTDTTGKVTTPGSCSGATATQYCQATFIGKANLQDITNPNAPVSIEGNDNLQVDLVDTGNNGTDTIGITLMNGNTLNFSNNWIGSKTTQQPLGGGNVTVH